MFIQQRYCKALLKEYVWESFKIANAIRNEGSIIRGARMRKKEEAAHELLEAQSSD